MDGSLKKGMMIDIADVNLDSFNWGKLVPSVLLLVLNVQIWRIVLIAIMKILDCF